MSMLRFEFANAVIAALGAKSYLQIGSARNLDDIVCAHKRSVHDAAEAPAGPFDVVFVDPPMEGSRALFALHVAMERVSPTGVILVANVNPTEAWMQEVPPSQGVQLGQAWRAWVQFRWSCGCGSWTADIDHGVGMVFAKIRDPWFVHPDLAAMGLATYEAFRAGVPQCDDLLGLMDPEQVLRILSAPDQPPIPDASDLAPTVDLTPTSTSAPVADPEPAPTPRRKRRDRSAP